MSVAVRVRSRSMGLIVVLAGTAALLAVAAVVQRDEGPDSLTWLGAVGLGMVEGLTEYLPVSSTGHLLVSGRILGLGGTESQDQALDTYAICIQLGAIAAVLVLYRQRVAQLFRGLTGSDADGRRILIAMVAAFTPTVILALSLQDVVRDRLFGPGPIAVAWVVGGVLILAVPSARQARDGSIELPGLDARRAAMIGLAQAVALWPGTSRSLVTIVAALAVGLSLRAAVEFSFLLGLVTLGAATVYEGAQNGGELIDTFGVVTPLLGLVVAFVSAVAAVRWMVSYLEDRGLELFGWYRIAIGVATFGAMGIGWL